jgi:hypothetical protein
MITARAPYSAMLVDCEVCPYRALDIARYGSVPSRCRHPHGPDTQLLKPNRDAARQPSRSATGEGSLCSATSAGQPVLCH